MVSGVPRTTPRAPISAKPALEKTCSLRVALDQMYEKSNPRNSPQHIRLWCSNQLNIRTKIARMSNECSCATTLSKAIFTRNYDEFHRFKQKTMDMSGPERTCTTGAGGVKPLTPKASSIRHAERDLQKVARRSGTCNRARTASTAEYSVLKGNQGL